MRKAPFGAHFVRGSFTFEDRLAQREARCSKLHAHDFMRWFAYFILAYVSLGLQIGVAPFIRFQGAAPNLVLLAVIFIAINAPRDAALLGAFFLGLLQDLLTQQQPGIFAFSYGLIAMFVVSTQQVVYREHPLTHASLTLVGGIVCMIVILMHGWIHPPGPKTADTAAAVRLQPTLQFTRVLYTATLAPLVLGILQKLKRGFAFQPTRRKIKAW